MRVKRINARSSFKSPVAGQGATGCEIGMVVAMLCAIGLGTLVMLPGLLTRSGIVRPADANSNAARSAAPASPASSLPTLTRLPAPLALPTNLPASNPAAAGAPTPSAPASPRKTLVPSPGAPAPSVSVPVRHPTIDPDKPCQSCHTLQRGK